MYEITKKEYLSKTSVLMNVKAPLVAAKAEAGQFIILRSDKDGERPVSYTHLFVLAAILKYYLKNSTPNFCVRGILFLQILLFLLFGKAYRFKKIEIHFFHEVPRFKFSMVEFLQIGGVRGRDERHGAVQSVADVGKQSMQLLGIFRVAFRHRIFYYLFVAYYFYPKLHLSLR